MATHCEELLLGVLDELPLRAGEQVEPYGQEAPEAGHHQAGRQLFVLVPLAFALLFLLLHAHSGIAEKQSLPSY